MKNEIKLEVGKSYKDKLGNTKFIVSKHKEMIFPFIYKTYYKDMELSSLKEDGRFIGYGLTESIFDLVEEIINIKNTLIGKELYK